MNLHNSITVLEIATINLRETNIEREEKKKKKRGNKL